MPRVDLDEIILKLEAGDYVIGYRPPLYIAKKIAKELKKKEEFKQLSELMTKALDDWFRDREMVVTGRGKIRIE